MSSRSPLSPSLLETFSFVKLTRRTSPCFLHRTLFVFDRFISPDVFELEF